jgi:hypothetical protein
MTLSPIFVPYIHRTTTSHQIIDAFTDIFHDTVVSEIKLVMKCGSDGFTYQMAFIRFNCKVNKYTATRMNRGMENNQYIRLSYYCPFLKCHRFFRCHTQNPKGLQKMTDVRNKKNLSLVTV